MIVNKSCIDWLTMTTYKQRIGESWITQASELEEARETKRQQYQGYEWFDVGGSWFVGVGEQKGKPHWMAYATSEAAELAFRDARELILSREVNVSRIDVQRTIEQPVGWSQLELMRELEVAGWKPSLLRSPSVDGRGELMTVYSGKRTSGRMNRTYQKESIDGVEKYVRFETEFGREYANALASDLARGRMTLDSVVNGEVLRRSGVKWLDWFLVGGGGRYSPRPERRRSRAKVEKWYIEAVLPSLSKYVNSHDCNPEMLRMFMDVIDRGM